MFETVDGRTTDRPGVTGILLAHPRAFGSGELKMFIFLALKLSGVKLILLVNVKMPTTVGI